ncbi:MAG: hypothetical protein JXL80_13365 [Planctomycetes bacterium]|nr:hypothetical protein [Planctomycetota bacterium]
MNDAGNPEWGESALSRFMEDMHHNSFATHANRPPLFARWCSIDETFTLAEKCEFSRRDESRFILPFFLNRSHSAFRGGVHLCSGGMTTETYILARACLENACYAFLIHDDKDKAWVWAKRGDTDEDTKKCRKVFTMPAAGEAIAKCHEPLFRWSRRLYDRTIEYGAHPNVNGLLTTASVGEDLSFVQMAAPGTQAWQWGAQSLCEVAVCVLRLFEIIFESEFRKSGTSQRIAGFDWMAIRENSE